MVAVCIVSKISIGHILVQAAIGSKTRVTQTKLKINGCSNVFGMSMGGMSLP
jgi:hypothetical protein